MTYRGRVQNGVIVFDDEVALPEGAIVRVEQLEDESPAQGSSGTFAERMLRHAGTAGDGLPTDLARNHDHYLHGQPKR